MGVNLVLIGCDLSRKTDDLDARKTKYAMGRRSVYLCRANRI